MIYNQFYGCGIFWFKTYFCIGFLFEHSKLGLQRLDLFDVWVWSFDVLTQTQTSKIYPYFSRLFGSKIDKVLFTIKIYKIKKLFLSSLNRVRNMHTTDKTIEIHQKERKVNSHLFTDWPGPASKIECDWIKFSALWAPPRPPPRAPRPARFRFGCGGFLCDPFGSSSFLHL